jgi:hypothetical protein
MIRIGLIFVMIWSTSASADSVTKLIGDNVVKPLTEAYSDHITEALSEGNGPLADAAKKRLEKKAVQQQIEHDKEMLKRNQAIAEAKRCKVDCKPRPIQECMKPNYTVDDDVIGCSQGKITKTW